ncbi:THO complex subunit 4 [Drosophila sulfurigaster albostrigata]|uniref:THO complex subunit 4 n=1 Tax=Drosophila albomicans TaxID=7291 RepID=A0A6P8XJB4_DROAB|nr:THO complex subunit 4 [Drosophila albomicans]XP_060650307.1 THO complex subunit 4 [Drosophila nasuta]XP_062126445.1 THO complex subunit 4 [Drosophila sulfurigaster albostrigata]
MVDKIEMSLDDIIKSTRTQKKPQGSTRGGPGGARRSGGQQRFAAGAGPRRGGGSPRKPAPASGAGGVLKGRRGGAGGGGVIQKPRLARGDVNSAWKHDMYDGPKRNGGAAGSSAGPTRLIVGNLDYGVSNTDIKELFNDFGPMKKAAVHYDRSGRSLGTADVIFERRSDALKAIKQYHGVPLDGRPMTIQLAVSDVAALTRPLPADDVKRRVGSGPQFKRGGGQAGGAPRRGSFKRPAGGKPAPGAGGAGGQRRERKAPPTAEELDAELDSYINDMKLV